MMNPLVAVCQMRSTADKVKNLELVAKLIEEAKRRSAIVAFLPEGCDFLASNKKQTVTMAEPLDGPTVSKYKSLAVKNDMWLSLGGIHETSNNVDKIYNTHILINNKGILVSAYRKIHLFDMDNKETGIRLIESDYVLKGNEVLSPILTPIGSLSLSIGAQILTYPSAFTYQTGAAHWDILLRARAIETQCYVIAAAQTGAHNDKRVSWGHAMIVDPWGTVIAQCSDKAGIAVAAIDLHLLEKIRKSMPTFEHRRPNLYF